MKTWIEPVARPLLALYWRMTRGLTLGVRCIVIDGGRVLLVRHGYVPGWHFPGGGVEAGETAHDALARELREETGVELAGPAVLTGVHHHAGLAGRDHVLVFRADNWRAGPVPAPNREIAEVRWFPLDALPRDVSRATRARLDELRDGASPSPVW